MHLARRATPELAHIGGLVAVGGLATLPGLLVTDFYDLALAEALPRAQSAEIADAAASGWVPAPPRSSPRAAGLHRDRRPRRRRLARGRRPGLDAVRAGRRLAGRRSSPDPPSLPAVAGASLILAVFGTVAWEVVRMSDQAWAERPSARSRTTRAKAPKIAAESAAGGGIAERPPRHGRRARSRRPAPARPSTSRISRSSARWSTSSDGTGRPTRGGRGGTLLLGPASRAFQQFRGPRRWFDAVLVPVQPVGAGGERCQRSGPSASA